MAGPSLPLNARRVLTKSIILNRLYMFVNGIAILALFYYRATTLLRVIKTRETPVVPYLIVIFSEIVLTFFWVLYQAFRWRPVKLEAYPERLPEDEKLQPVDVFICTADPSKEPSLGVMNTVISAMALDYPPDKLSIYLQDDGGSYVTLNAIREAWKFARFWVPFRRKYELKIACPAAYFSSKESAHEKFIGSSEFSAEKKIIEKKYAEFVEALEKNSVNASASVSRDHSPVIEVMTDENGDANLKDMPLLVYVAREKRPGHPHHFKGGALNALLRVSAVITNAPYFLVLDCDMYCYNPLSARLAMCFYLDPKVASKIAWVQFPQKFHNLSEHDIYGGSLNAIYKSNIGLDGLRGPNIYGCNFVMTREAIYGTGKVEKEVDLNKLKKSFGSSNEFIKSLYKTYKPQLPENRKPSAELQKELQLLASCTYDNGTDWGEEASAYC
ncbi:UNVERIFIED_CONTAM: Cellulose synthase-like protein E6 [Sesamum radiatum]|uniref:Cellulose synthase-like protein E6 n=1 Tax=Sesamum radiatum TaxID=300843 RepID=A0AAW2UAS2_SESRA